jgi:hypothetical protein
MPFLRSLEEQGRYPSSWQVVEDRVYSRPRYRSGWRDGVAHTEVSQR